MTEKENRRRREFLSSLIGRSSDQGRPIVFRDMANGVMGSEIRIILCNHKAETPFLKPWERTGSCSKRRIRSIFRSLELTSLDACTDDFCCWKSVSRGCFTGIIKFDPVSLVVCQSTERMKIHSHSRHQFTIACQALRTLTTIHERNGLHRSYQHIARMEDTTIKASAQRTDSELLCISAQVRADWVRIPQGKRRDDFLRWLITTSPTTYPLSYASRI